MMVMSKLNRHPKQPIVTRLHWFFLATALFSFAYVSLVELTGRGDLPMNIDEIFYSVCSSRGIAVDQIPIAGCHDNKAPLIYVVYQALQKFADPYSLIAIKILAISISVVALFAVAGLAFRLGGNAAAASIAAALAMHGYALTPGLMALKPDLIGSLLVLIAMLVLLPMGNRPENITRIFLAGLIFGAAISFKQTFVFGLIGVVAWLILGCFKGYLSLRQTLFNLLVMALGSVIVPLIFLAIFWESGQLIDFLASVFAYPAMYGSAEKIGFIKGIANRLYQVEVIFSHYGAVAYLLIAAFAYFLKNGPPTAGDKKQNGFNFSLMFLVCGAFFALLFIAPIRSTAYALPAALLAAPIVGVFVVSWISKWQTAELALPIGAVAIVFSIVVAVDVWAGPSGNPLTDRDRFFGLKIDRPPKYGYVVGVWPKFYFDNKIIPASSVMYPNAFPAAEGLWLFKAPSPDGLLGRSLPQLYKHNIERIRGDFIKNPPGVIVVLDGEGRSAASKRFSDNDFIQEYIEKNCVFDKDIDGRPRLSGTMFHCGENAR